MPKTRSSRSMRRRTLPLRSTTFDCTSGLRRLLADHDQSAIRPGDRTAQRDQVALGVNRQDTQVFHRHPSVAQVTGHAHALERPTWSGARTDRARMTPAIGLAVGLRPATEVVALDHATEALAFGRANHIDDLALDKHAGIDACTKLEVLETIGRHFAHGLDAVLVGQASFLQVAFVWLRRARPLAKPELDGGIAVHLLGAQLRDEARTSLHQGGSRHNTVFIEEPGHAQLSSEESLNHTKLSAISYQPSDWSCCSSQLTADS